MFTSQITGNLTADPQLREVGKSVVCNFTVATATSHFIEGTPKTEFVRVAIWGKRAEAASAHLKKGSAVVCWGDLYSDEHKAPDGSPRFTLNLGNAAWEFGRGSAQQNEPQSNSETEDEDLDMFDE